jgi:hypothetical protein
MVWLYSFRQAQIVQKLGTNITQILNSAASLQNKKGTRPLVIDYDTANTSLHVVERANRLW